MVSENDPALYEVSIFIRAVENVFRKLSRLLIGRISLNKLQELFQVVFVEEAEAKLKQDAPGQPVALGDLVLLTGLDARTIKKTRTYIALSKLIHQDESFLSELIPESCVLDIWESSSKYTDKKNGKPRILKIKGPGASFESLVSESISTREVSVESFLKRLVASKSVLILKEKKEVQMIDKHYTTFELHDETANLKFGLAVVGNLLDTVNHNLLAPAQSEVAFYQRGCWTRRLKNEDCSKFREIFRRFLSKMDEEAREILKQYEQELASDDQKTAGISMFYFEETVDGPEQSDSANGGIAA